MRMTHSMCLALASSALVASISLPARAEEPGDDVIVLSNGGKIRGTLIEALPGDHATMLLPSGESAVVAWRDLARIDRHAEVSLDAPSPAPAVTPTPRHRRRDGRADAIVHIASPRHVTLERREDGQWTARCESPCDAWLPIEGPYRLVGDDIKSSVDFDLIGSPGDRVVLHVSPSTKLLHYGGLTAVGAGVLLVATGIMYEGQPRTADTGTAVILLGLAVTAIGAYLGIVHWSTGQTQERAALPALTF